MPKGLLSDKRDVLVYLYGYFITRDERGYVHPKNLKEKTNLRLSSSYVSLMLASLMKENLVEAVIDDDDDDIFTLTEAGVLAAEKEIASRGITLDEFEIEFRKSSNFGLFVDSDHPDAHAALQTLEELQEHLKTDNDVGAIEPDERAVAIDEVESLHEALKKPKVRTHYIWSKAHEVLLWIIEKGGSSIVGELAKKALSHIHSFINVFFN